jgi:hypothetical protein
LSSKVRVAAALVRALGGGPTQGLAAAPTRE